MRQYQEVFKEYDPERKTEGFDSEELGQKHEPFDLKDVDYGKKPEWAKRRPITKEDSLKHRE